MVRLPFVQRTLLGRMPADGEVRTAMEKDEWDELRSTQNREGARLFAVQAGGEAP